MTTITGIYISNSLISLIIDWIIISLALYVSAKIIVGKSVSGGEAVVAALFAAIIIFIVGIFTEFFASLLGEFALIVGLVIDIILLSALFGSMFRTRMSIGFVIGLLALVIGYVISIVVAALGFGHVI